MLMRYCIYSFLLLLIGTLPLDAQERPNILIVLADDLGFSDLGCYGGEIKTPHLDRLAAGGVRFSQFYNTGRCWPTRGSLLTGFYAQQIRRDKLPGIKSGARGERPAWARLVPETLRILGYRTYHSGKWHVDGMPLENGFVRSYYLRDQGRFFNPKIHYLNDKKLPPVETGTEFYGTTAIADHAVKCLQDHANNHPKQPFFHYLAFTAPHFPLHGLPEDIARYETQYRRDWAEVRRERWERQKRVGLIRGGLSAVERNLGPPYAFPDAIKKLGPGEVNRPLAWGDLTTKQQDFQAIKMAIHAAMIDRLDRELGKVLNQIREMDAWDSTLILFLSDNGASAEIMVRDDGHDPNAPPGSAATYLCLGPGWSTTCNTPFRRHKTWVHEGGIATPLIAHWPNEIKAHGQIVHQPGHVIDLVPTLFEITGVKGHGAGEEHDPPMRPGRSLMSAMVGSTQIQPRELWWNHDGNRAIRSGNWKLVAAGEGAPWELYDLANDRSEQKDLAALNTKQTQRLSGRWEALQLQFIDQASRDLRATVKKSSEGGRNNE